MKISTRIIAGYGALIVLIAGHVALEIFVTHRMQRITSEISQVNFRSSVASLELMRLRDVVEELVRKTFASGGDVDYLKSLKTSVAQFKNAVDEQVRMGSTQLERDEAKGLQADLTDFQTEIVREQDIMSSEDFLEVSQPLEERLERLRTQVVRTYQATLAAKESELAKSRVVGRRTEMATWFLAGLALTGSVVVSFFLVRSITTPLNHLTVGTRKITEGQFDYRLDTSRGDEFAQLANDFNVMTQRLNELDQMKRDFVSHVSHELKAPLASIRETLQLMAEELPGPLTQKQKRLIEINLMCARRLSSMIGNLLDLSRMDAGMMEYELKRNDIVALMQTAMEEYEPQAREKSLQLVADFPESPLPVHCDGDRIIQVIGNVLGNAIKFSPAGAHIRIHVQSGTSPPQRLPEPCRRSLSAQAENGRYVTIAVADSGPGIPEELKEKIFKKFRQLRQEKVPAGQGVGLGLAISRTIMTAHHGAIWAEDNPAGGSIFYLLIPAGSAGSEVVRRASAPI